MFECGEGAGDGGVVGMEDAGEGIGVHDGVSRRSVDWENAAEESVVCVDYFHLLGLTRLSIALIIKISYFYINTSGRAFRPQII